MPMRSDWVEELFGRLTLRYGNAFKQQYADLDPQAVMADWASVLHGFSGESVKYGIENLPDTPVNAGQFKAIMLRKPAADPLPALTRPYVSDPAEVRARLDKLRQKLTAA